jgi:hypothetical protein
MGLLGAKICGIFDVKLGKRMHDSGIAWEIRILGPRKVVKNELSFCLSPKRRMRERKGVVDMRKLSDASITEMIYDLQGLRSIFSPICLVDVML